MVAAKSASTIRDRRTRINSRHLEIVRNALKEYKAREYESSADYMREAMDEVIEIFRTVKRTQDKRGW